MKEIDPSEAADAEAILPAIRDVFPEASINMLGGAVYNVALTGALACLDEHEHANYIDGALFADSLLAAMGYNHYATAIARL
jgi:hypothetical protein